MNKSYLSAFVSISIMITVSVGSSASAQSGLASAYCQAHMPIVMQAIQMRRDGIPIDISRDMADSAFDVNVDLWNWLNYAIQEAYRDPDSVQAAINDGYALDHCIENVRGY